MPVHKFNAPLNGDTVEQIARLERAGEEIVSALFDRHNDLWVFTRDRVETRGAA